MHLLTGESIAATPAWPSSASAFPQLCRDRIPRTPTRGTSAKHQPVAARGQWDSSGGGGHSRIPQHEDEAARSVLSPGPTRVWGSRILGREIDANAACHDAVFNLDESRPRLVVRLSGRHPVLSSCTRFACNSSTVDVRRAAICYTRTTDNVTSCPSMLALSLWTPCSGASAERSTVRVSARM